MYLALQSTYEHIEIGLFSDNHCLQSQTVSKMDATRLLIPTLNELLIQHSLSLTQIDCIIANKGPAPFTTLRVLLSTLNGIAFSTPIPLIEVNGLEAFMHELKQQHPTNNIAIILNAFSGQSYYLIEANGQQEMGCKKNDELIAQLNGIPNLLAAGNGIKLLTGLDAEIQSIAQEYVSLKTIAYVGLKKFNEHIITKKIEPLYLKEAL